MKEHLFIILEKLVTKNNILVHKNELKLQLLSHPSYPSLHAVTGVLNHFAVPNVALRLPTNEATLRQLPKNFIANITSEEHGEGLVLVQKKKDRIAISRDINQGEEVSYKTFLKGWTGIVVLIEKDETVADLKASAFNKSVQKALPVVVLVIMSLFIMKTPEIFVSTHFVLSIVGAMLSIVIVKQEMGLSSNITNNFCNLSTKTSCEEILNSKGATIFKVFKLSDISLVVFFGYILSWLLFSLSANTNHTTFIVCSILAIPATVYSIYYQAVIVKKWCPLCLGIVGVLLLQSTLVFLNQHWVTSFYFTSEPTLLFTISMLVVTFSWGSLSTILKSQLQLNAIKIDHFKFKRKFKLFKTLLANGQHLLSPNEIKGEIILGNTKASTHLILVTSPFCHYCKTAHSDIEYLLNLYPNQLKVSILLRIDTTNKKSDLYKIGSELLYRYHTKKEEVTIDTLHKLYAESADLKKWVSNTEIHYHSKYDEIMQNQNKWCDLNNISFTPALYLNGVEYPKEYDRKDLALFMDELEDIDEGKITRLEQKSLAS